MSCSILPFVLAEFPGCARYFRHQPIGIMSDGRRAALQRPDCQHTTFRPRRLVCVNSVSRSSDRDTQHLSGRVPLHFVVLASVMHRFRKKPSLPDSPMSSPPPTPAHGSPKESGWGTAYEAAKIAIDIVNESSDMFLPLKAVVGALSVLIKNYDVRFLRGSGLIGCLTTLAANHR